MHNYLKVQDASTTNGGVWITFLVVCALYIAVATTLILVMRRMSRRWREQRELDESDVPYGPTPISLIEADVDTEVSVT